MLSVEIRRFNLGTVNTTFNMQERPYLCQYNETQSNYDPTEGILDTDLNSLFIDPWGGKTFITTQVS